MARTNGSKTDGSKTERSIEQLPAVADPEETATTADESEPGVAPQDEVDTQDGLGAQDIDDSLNALKALLSTVEKLQKVRQEVGDIKPLVLRMLDGEVISGEELEQLKSGVGGLFRLVRAYSDHQSALAKAQPARDLLDQVLK